MRELAQANTIERVRIIDLPRAFENLAQREHIRMVRNGQVQLVNLAVEQGP